MHIQKKWVSGVLSSLLFTLLLAACSSGGGDSAAQVVPVCTAEGLWTGTMAGRTVNGAVLDNRTYWFLYSAVGAPTIMAGTLQGDCSTSNGTFTSSNGLDFSNDFQEKFPVTVTGPYVIPLTLDGTVTYSGGGQLTFTSTFNSENSVTPVISNVDDTYSGSVFGFPHTITISNLGVVTVTTPPNTGYTTGVSVDVSGIELGCDFTGTLTPRSQGGNMYDIELTPDPSNIVTFPHCNPATLTGVAFFDATDNKRIYVLALNSTRTRVFPFTGTRP
jgi:hypothetical protein